MKNIKYLFSIDVLDLKEFREELENKEGYDSIEFDYLETLEDMLELAKKIKNIEKKIKNIKINV